MFEVCGRIASMLRSGLRYRRPEMKWKEEANGVSSFNGWQALLPEPGAGVHSTYGVVIAPAPR